MAPQPTPTKPTPDADQVARAATERADKLEKELAALKLEHEKVLRLNATRHTVAPAPLAEAHKGTKTYRLTQPHYRRGVSYAAGETITVTDEKPGKSWVLVQKVAATELVDAPVKTEGRAADQQT